MGFGFVVARFGLFLQQVQVIEHLPSPSSYGLSLWFGTALIIVGVLVFLLSAMRYTAMVRQLNQSEAMPVRPSTQAILISLFLALVGLAMAIYLVTVRSSAKEFSRIEEKPMNLAADKGIIDRRSNHTVDQTVEKLKNILESKGVTLFALVNHSGEAEKVGMKMLPTKLLIFGSPKAGTPLMLAVPSIAIDLPLKILVWEDTGGQVWVSYNSSEYLKERHGLPSDLVQNIAIVAALAEKATE